MTLCPICESHNVRVVLSRSRLPVLQNVVFASQAEALASPCAPFELAVCNTCGFAFNSLFDSGALIYDERYDNDVPSTAHRQYYRDLAKQLVEQFQLQE